MAATHFQSVLEGRIQQEIADREQSVAQGDAPDYPHYRENVGYIRGLRAALAICSDLEKDSNQ